MSVSTPHTARGSGRRMTVSRGTGVLLVVAVTAALVGTLVGRFLTYSDEPAVPLPTVVVPSDAEVRALQARAEATPDSAAAWIDLGTAATRQAIATADPAWYGLATRAFDTARDLAPDDPLLTVAAGQLALSLHDFPRALELGRAAVAALPATADAWGVLVDASVELGDYATAESALQTMLDLDPDLAALARASYLRQLNGDLDGAIVALRQARSAAVGAGLADAGVIGTLLGEVLLHAGELDQAQQAFAQASTPAAAVGLARVAVALGQESRAQQILLDVVARTPVPAAVTALAEVQQRRGDDAGLAETVELARTLASLQEDAGQQVDVELALFEASFGDPSRAVALAEAAFADRPDNVFAAGALAWALHAAGRDDEARDHATAALRLGTVDTAHELRMAEVLGEEDLLRTVLDRNPIARELFLP